MGNSKKQYLTGTVHRLHEGVLESLYAGDEAPDWVTNPKVLSEAQPGEPASLEATEPGGQTQPAGDPGMSSDEEVDDLTGLDGKALKKIAGELGLKQTGSKPVLTAAIRAKRAEATPAPAAEDAERTALIEQLKAKGIEVDESLTEAELQALAEEE
ncbi:hypothetical protein [Microbacterium sp. H6]|uniref:hypothetical protein n=1 Tax=Microbacterium sp. H6 TaxID=421122 RepID=UPI000DE3543A|nr:hypothetical protein [Microbacterium sp. H6]RBO73531.1 hypothetical protein DSP71_05080 [Microbacterium sp. H6]